MKKKSEKSIVPLIIVLLILWYLFKNFNFGGLIRTALILGFVVTIVALILIALVTVFAIRTGKEHYDKSHGKTDPGSSSGKEAAKREKENREKEAAGKAKAEREAAGKDGQQAYPAEIVEAEKKIARIRVQAAQIRDIHVSEAAERCLLDAGKLNDSLKEQQDDIRRNRQFFNYYLPTLGTVTDKYLTVEKGGVQGTSAKEDALECMNTLDEAFRKLHENLFTDEVANLSIEKKALDSIMKKDGLKSDGAFTQKKVSV